MKILVLNNMVPFVRGGAELLADHLVGELKLRGHQADLLRIPFSWNPLERIYDEILACQMLELWDVERVIALKFPAYLVPHSQKTLWLLHQFRQVYDLWPAEKEETAGDLLSHSLRSTVQAVDNLCFDHARRVYCNSPTTQNRLLRYNDRQGEVLPPPLNDPHLFRTEGYGDYIFCGGRINAGKRQHLLIEAMRYVRTPVRLIVVGPPDSETDGFRLQRLVDEYHLAARVDLQLGYASRETISRLVNHSLACAYLPIDEDSFGYVAMEACQAEKALLTATDSGGVLGLVEPGETGLVVPPDPREIAHALDDLWDNRKRTERWGNAAKSLWDRQCITWDHTIEKLLQ